MQSGDTKKIREGWKSEAKLFLVLNANLLVCHTHSICNNDGITNDSIHKMYSITHTLAVACIVQSKSICSYIIIHDLFSIIVMNKKVQSHRQHLH